MLRLAGVSYDAAENRFHNEAKVSTMRAELIVRFKPCMTEIYLKVDARISDYIHTHPYYYRYYQDLPSYPRPGAGPRDPPVMHD